MKMIIGSNEISKVARILADNNFINVKDKYKLEKYLYVYISNYYMLSAEKNFTCNLNYINDINDKDYIFLNIVSDYNFLFNENIELKRENIKITIEKGGNNE
ncbi:MAG: hypothetical protein SOT71_08205 [Romboutsia timonensis]|uniref:hypothetical protein n=1 Tax=Romboutsia timonensis TaxID=1776391 RepID=UPI002A7567F2|nr:hypothetical protein [Romboutsia timonensis]MDY2882621.1 hypothetical protein [Romboutsia timonensis]